MILVDVCDPDPCGANALCRNISSTRYACDCKPGYIGNGVKGCYRECEISKHCRYHQSCVNYTCVNPCDVPSACGINATCRPRAHQAACACPQHYTGDPSIECSPQCTSDGDCSLNKTCVNYKCVDPCENACGYNSKCDVIKHVPTCSCPADYTGNPQHHCRKYDPRKYCNVFFK